MKISLLCRSLRELVRACGKTHNAEIVMNTRLTPSEAAKVKDLHGKVIGYMDKPCDECQSLIAQGTLLIQCDESKTDDTKNPYRTGKQCVVKPEAAQRIFGMPPTQRVAFVTIEAWDKIGLP